MVRALSESFRDLRLGLAAEAGLRCEVKRTLPRDVDSTRSAVLLAADGEEVVVLKAARELRNVLERTVLFEDARVLDALALEVDSQSGDMSAGDAAAPVTFTDIIAHALRHALDACGSNHSEAPRRLGGSRPRIVLIRRGGDSDAAEGR